MVKARFLGETFYYIYMYIVRMRSKSRFFYKTLNLILYTLLNASLDHITDTALFTFST